MDVQHILKIRTSPRQRSDFISWFPEKSGIFSVKSAYRLATYDNISSFSEGATSASASGSRSLWNCVWQASVPQKMKITAWQVILGVLPTQKCKVLRHIPTTSTCRLCGLEEEGTFHALVACDHARAIWLQMRDRWPLPPDEFLLDNGREWLMHLLCRSSNDVRDMIIMLVWRIWQLRNDQTHGKEVPPVSATVDFLDSYYKSIKLAGCYSVDEILKGKMPSSAIPTALPRKENISPPWPAPGPGYVALTVDGSFQVPDNSAAAGMVLRDHQGQIIFAAYRVLFHCNDALEAELHALMQGMALAIQHSESPVVVQSDSSEALASLSSDALTRSAYGHLVLEIKELMSNREFVPLKICRSQNRVADRLANYSRSERTTAVWLRSVPPCIEDLWPLDCNSIPMQ